MATTKTDIPLHMLAVTSGATLASKTGAPMFEFDVPVGATSAGNTAHFEFEPSASAAAPVEIAAKGAFDNTSIAFAPKGTGEVRIIGNSTSAGGIRFYEDTDNGANFTGLRAPILAGNYTLTLPKSAGTAGYALTLGADVTDPLQWKEALTDGGAFGSLTLTDSAGALQIDVATGDASIIFDNAGTDRWVIGAASSGNIFRINKANSSGVALSAAFMFQLTTSGAAHVQKSLHVGGNSSGSAQGTASLVAATAASAAFLRLAEDTDDGSHFGTIKPIALGANRFYSLPDATGTFIVGSAANKLPKDAIAVNFTLDQISAAGDVNMLFAQTGNVRFSVGLDDSDGDIFKIHSGTTLANDSDFEIDFSGNVEIKNGNLTVAEDIIVTKKIRAAGLSAAGITATATDSTAGFITLNEDTDNGVHIMKLSGPRLLGADQTCTLPNTGGDVLTSTSMIWGDLTATTPDGLNGEMIFGKQASINGAGMLFRNGAVALTTPGGQHVVSQVTSAAAGSATGICLANSAGLWLAYGEVNAPSTVDNYYNGWQIRIVEGTGRGEQTTISDYTGATLQASVSPVWTSAGVIPDATSVYVLIQNDYTFIAKHNGSTTGTAVAYFAKDNQGDLPQAGDVIYACYSRLASSVA